VSESPIRLSKPLYKEEVPASSPSDTPLTPTPRDARASVFARTAAIVVDIMGMHLVLLSLLKLVPGPIAALGSAGPYVGLGIAFLYMTICNLTGRSFGRLLLRLELVRINAEPITPAIAIARAAFVVGPLFIYQICQQLAESLTKPEELSVVPPALAYGAMAFVVAWYSTNFIFVGFDATGRSFYDRLLGTQVITTDSDPADQANLLSTSRELGASMQLTPVGRMLAGLCATLPFLLVIVFIFSSKSYLDSHPDVLARNLEERKALHVAGFALPRSRQMVYTTEEERKTTDTMGVQFDYLRRAPLELSELTANPRAMTAIDRATSVTASMWQSMVRNEMDQTTSTRLEQIRKIRRITTKVDFVELSDLFFATNPRSVYSTSRSLELVNGLIPDEVLEQVSRDALK
jgi:uncharacterized RDD family membrane protein YckC